MNKPKLGQRVTASDRLYRECDFGGRKTWKRCQDVNALGKKPKPVDGIYIGYRTKSNGVTEYHSDYFEWIPSEYFTVYLIVESDRTNPVYVLPEDVQ